MTIKHMLDDFILLDYPYTIGFKAPFNEAGEILNTLKRLMEQHYISSFSFESPITEEDVFVKFTVNK